MDGAEAASPSGGEITDQPARGRDTFASLSLPQFRFLLAGTATSQIASWMEEVARGWLVLELTGSAFQLGLIGFIRGITQLLFSPVAGVLVDRLDRRRLAAITQVVPGTVALIIGLLVATDRIEMWQLYVLTCVSGLTAAVNQPARQVLVYDVVGEQYLTNAIALNAVTANVSRIVAPAVGGLFIGVVGIASSYYVQTLFFLLATGATLLLHPITHADPLRTPMLEGIKDGLSYARRDRTVGRLIVLNAIPNLLIYPYVAMMPLFADDVLNVGSFGFGVLLTAVGFGSIPGGLFVAGMSHSPHKGRTMSVAMLLYMGMVAAFGMSTVFPVSFLILVLAGVGWSMMVTLNQTLLQSHVEDVYRGRVLALHSMVGGFTPFGNLAMGITAATFGVQASVVAFAMIGFTCAAILGLGSRRIREL
jgi:MFS family permease